MKRLMLVGAMAMTGCAPLTQLAVETSLLALSKQNGMPPPEPPRDDDATIQSLINQSRAKIAIHSEGPCQVESHRTGRRTWRIESCQGETKCWVVGEDGYECRTEQQPFAL